MANPFEVRGTITVQDSATVICARRHPVGAVHYLSTADCGGEDSNNPFLDGIFGAEGRIAFRSEWEVLVGQSEVVNFLRSTPEKLALMRYAGEWKLAGGNVDGGEAVADAARRELQEEFLDPLGLARLPVPEYTLRPFVTKQTRPIRSRSNLMHCHVALEDENRWLQELDVGATTAALAARRERFVALANDGSFWELPAAQREAVTPEVRRLAWLPLHEAVGHCLSSMAPGCFVNSFQRAEYARFKKRRRDPMFITAACLMELEGFPDAGALRRHCASVDLPALTAEEQWLFTGMDQAAVDEAFAARVSGAAGAAGQQLLNPSFKPPARIAELRQQRMAAGAGSAAKL